MAHRNMQEEFYYVVLKSCRTCRWLADERVKQQFLNRLLVVKKEVSFRVYAFCILDQEAHFLLGIPGGRSIGRVTSKISRELLKSYSAQYPRRKEETQTDSVRLSDCSYAAVLEQCCRIHLLARGYAEKIQDYWWSSYVEYLHKNITGLVETEAILRVLDAEPRRALQKFVKYHEKYIPSIKDGLEKKK